jgi:hypothetical protein
MRLKIVSTSVVLLLSLECATATAQAKPSVSRAPEVAIAYDLVGSNAPAGTCGCFILNGGSITGAFPVHTSLSVVGQLSATHGGGIGPRNYDLTLLTFTGGIRYTPMLHTRVKPFVQGLIGGTHASGSLVESPNPGARNAGVALAGSVGGGVDIPFRSSISIRAIEADYLPTTYDNNTSSLQNNYRISAGVVFRLHR